MNIWEAIILGIVQGLTEFLPVSSSGHLTLGKAILGISEKGILFEVIVHLGTLFAVFTAFWQDILWLLRGIMAKIRPSRARSFIAENNDPNALKYVAYIMWATIPAMIVGLLLENYIEDAFSNPLLTCYLLLATGGILLLSRLRLKAAGRMTIRRSIVIGIVQAFAILPGISRSGSTIAAGMLLGIEREEAARFSFLMAIPAISGAFALQIRELVASPPTYDLIVVLIIGFFVSYASGFAAIKILMTVVRKGRFDYFAWYCFAVGLLGIYLLR